MPILSRFHPAGAKFFRHLYGADKGQSDGRSAGSWQLPIELWDTGSGQLLASIDDPFVVRQVNFAFTKSGLVLHTDYGAMSIYSCAL